MKTIEELKEYLESKSVEVSVQEKFLAELPNKKIKSVISNIYKDGIRKNNDNDEFGTLLYQDSDSYISNTIEVIPMENTTRIKKNNRSIITVFNDRSKKDIYHTVKNNSSEYCILDDKNRVIEYESCLHFYDNSTSHFEAIFIDDDHSILQNKENGQLRQFSNSIDNFEKINYDILLNCKDNAITSITRKRGEEEITYEIYVLNNKLLRTITNKESCVQYRYPDIHSIMDFEMCDDLNIIFDKIEDKFKHAKKEVFKGFYRTNTELEIFNSIIKVKETSYTLKTETINRYMYITVGNSVYKINNNDKDEVINTLKQLAQ